MSHRSGTSIQTTLSGVSGAVLGLGQALAGALSATQLYGLSPEPWRGSVGASIAWILGEIVVADEQGNEGQDTKIVYHAL